MVSTVYGFYQPWFGEGACLGGEVGGDQEDGARVYTEPTGIVLLVNLFHSLLDAPVNLELEDIDIRRCLYLHVTASHARMNLSPDRQTDQLAHSGHHVLEMYLLVRLMA